MTVVTETTIKDASRKHQLETAFLRKPKEQLALAGTDALRVKLKTKQNMVIIVKALRGIRLLCWRTRREVEYGGAGTGDNDASSDL